MGPGIMSMSGMGPGGPMPVSSSGMTIPTGPGSGSPHGSNPGTPLGGNVPMGPSSHPGNIPMGPSSHPGMGGQSPGMGPGGPSPGHPSMGGPSPGHPGMGGPSPGHPGMGGPSPGHPGMGGPSPGHPGIGGPSPGHPGMGGPSPLSMSSEKIYPSDQPMVFNPQNPNAPPIYPCGICHKEVHDNDQAILCESGCNFWFHRVCTGLVEAAFHFLTQEIYAEWVCDRCFSQKEVPLVKFKP